MKNTSFIMDIVIVGIWLYMSYCYKCIFVMVARQQVAQPWFQRAHNWKILNFLTFTHFTPMDVCQFCFTTFRIGNGNTFHQHKWPTFYFRNWQILFDRIPNLLNYLNTKTSKKCALTHSQWKPFCRICYSEKLWAEKIGFPIYFVKRNLKIRWFNKNIYNGQNKHHVNPIYS